MNYDNMQAYISYKYLMGKPAFSAGYNGTFVFCFRSINWFFKALTTFMMASLRNKKLQNLDHFNETIIEGVCLKIDKSGILKNETCEMNRSFQVMIYFAAKSFAGVSSTLGTVTFKIPFSYFASMSISFASPCKEKERLKELNEYSFS